MRIQTADDCVQQVVLPLQGGHGLSLNRQQGQSGVEGFGQGIHRDDERTIPDEDMQAWYEGELRLTLTLWPLHDVMLGRE